MKSGGDFLVVPDKQHGEVAVMEVVGWILSPLMGDQSYSILGGPRSGCRANSCLKELNCGGDI